MKKNTYHFILITIAMTIIQLVGIVGMMFMGDWFKYITGVHLIISLAYLLAFHHPRTKSFLVSILLLFFIGYIIEFIGIQTGWPFGSYHYLYALGPKIAGVPIIIGVNWILLSYSSLQVAKLLHKNSHPDWLLCLKASLIMVTMDLLIEPLSEILGFWKWEYGYAPLQNYIAWYLFGFGFCWLIQKTSDSIIQIQGIVWYGLQLLFFISLFVYNLLI